MDKEVVQRKVPDSGRLAQAIEGLFKLPNLVRMVLVHKSRRLLDIDVAINFTVQKRGRYVQGLHGVPFVGSYREHQPKAGRCYHGTV